MEKGEPFGFAIAYARKRKTRTFLAFDVVKERTYEILQPLVDTTFDLVEKVSQFSRDGLITSQEPVYRPGKRRAFQDVEPGKEQTYNVEGTNADLRCYVSALGRTGHCFPRHLSKFRAVLRLFITCYNLCRLSRYKYPNRSVHPWDFLPTLF